MLEYSSLQAAIGEWVERWIRGVQRRPTLALIAVGSVVLGFGFAAVARLGVNSDVNAMIEQRLPFRSRELAFQRDFPTGVEAILVVVEARDPASARHSAERLAERLRQEPEQFRSVFLPWGGEFFRRNALLYLDTKELEDLADRLASAQPMLSALARGGNASGVFDLLRKALALRREGSEIGVDLAPALARSSDAIEAVVAGRAVPDPWGEGGGLLASSAIGDDIQVIQVAPKLDARDLLAAKSALVEIRRCVAEIGLDRVAGVRVRITGDPALNYEEMLALESQGVSLAAGSFLAVGGLLYAAFRAWRLVFVTLLTLLASLIVTAGFAALAVGDLNQLSVAFSVMLIGLGIDAGIHLTLRAAEMASDGRTLRETLPLAGSVLGGALASATLTTSIGFYAFVPTDFLAVAQLGLITGTGMLASLVLTLTLLPALLSFGTPPRVDPPRTTPRLLRALQQWPERFSRPICLGAAALALLSALVVSRVRFDNDAVALRDPSAESVQAFQDLLLHAHTSPWTIDLVRPRLAAADALAKELRKLPEVADASTLSDYVPEDQAYKRELVSAIAGFLPPEHTGPPAATGGQAGASLAALLGELARVEPAQDPGLAADARRLATALKRFAAKPGERGEAQLAALRDALLGSLPAQLDELRAALAPEEIAADLLPPDIIGRMRASDGRARIEVTPAADLSDGIALDRFVRAVARVAPDATGPAAVMVAWGDLASRAMAQASALALVGIAGLMWFQWRRWSAVLLALVPLVLAALYTIATMVALGMDFNLANVVVLPMMMGIGVDSGIYITERFHETAADAPVLGTATTRSVVYAALTTLASFASLSFASHRGMASLGQILALGLIITLVSYVVVLPAALRWIADWASGRAR